MILIKQLILNVDEQEIHIKFYFENKGYMADNRNVQPIETKLVIEFKNLILQIVAKACDPF